VKRAKPTSARQRISDEFIDEVCARLREGKRVRRTLPDGGRLHVDRPLPFLCVYRRPADRPDAGTERLVNGEASFLIVPGAPLHRKGVAALVRRLAETLAERFGAFLILEVWSASGGTSAAGLTDASGDDGSTRPAPRPGFALATRGPDAPRGAIDTLAKSLRRVRVQRRTGEVEVHEHTYGHPLGMPMLVSIKELGRLGCRLIGVEVRPIYRDAATGAVYPATIRALRLGFSRALKQAFYAFARDHTRVRPQHYYALGRRAMVKAVWEVDRRLAEIADTFDFLLQATPVNVEPAWREFRRNLFQVPPVFHYRPLAADPVRLKRRLYEVPIERIEDPTLAQLFRERQDDLDRKITLLTDIGTPRFVLGSLQIYGRIETSLLMLAHELLSTVPPRSRDSSSGGQVDAAELARRAAEEIDAYRARHPQFAAKVSVRDDMYWGLLVSKGDLLIGRQTRVPAGRVDALVQHEVGTHLVTYYNGRAQPFRQLYTGLAGFDGLQEGLAVLAEYLVGGLSRPRIRLLAARVVAAHQLVEGASLIDTFRMLCRTYEFPQRQAFTIAMRVYRAGGLTKDVVYLRGLVEILEHLRGGGELEPLFVGKIAVEHIPLVRELTLREVLRPPPITPHYLDRPEARDRLQRLRSGLAVRDLVQREKR